MATKYTSNVFINCPFDPEYSGLMNAIIFTVFACGFLPRCSREINDSGEVRIDKIQRLIKESKFGIHDISRTELDSINSLPRFNMPLELGLFMGAKRYGDSQDKLKVCLIMDVTEHRYQKFLSDISGQDIQAHDLEIKKLIILVRNWLQAASTRKQIPSGSTIHSNNLEFNKELPELCRELGLDINALTYIDYTNLVSNWLATKKSLAHPSI